MHEPIDIKELIPPGTYLEELRHPGGDKSKTKKMELAVFKEHRFSFFFWNRWMEQIENVDRQPDLVTIDWHRDIAPPSDSEKVGLKNLDLSNQAEVAKFAWSGLDAHNDSHILSAAVLNMIGDIYLLKNYGNYQESSYKDNFSNVHWVYEYHSPETFKEAVFSKVSSQVILDIDLDYFVRNKVEAHQLQDVEVCTTKEISEFMEGNADLFRFLFPRLAGITIATEPRYCGGLIKSNRILEALLDSFFTPEFQWRHLQI